MAAGITAVVDYGLCNIDSMVRALEECGASQVERTRDPQQVARADRIVLPGVGTFAAAMRILESSGLAAAICDAASRDVPFLGACLGMQLMATRGTEGSATGVTSGLGLVDGDVVRLEPKDKAERIPHIGWNDVSDSAGSPLFASLPSDPDFYFVHSYHLVLADSGHEAGRTEYCGGFVAAIGIKGRPLFGTQFHPEKSQAHGFSLLRNFLAV
jgi:glutamine amidotransferase